MVGWVRSEQGRTDLQILTFQETQHEDYTYGPNGKRPNRRIGALALRFTQYGKFSVACRLSAAQDGGEREFRLGAEETSLTKLLTGRTSVTPSFRWCLHRLVSRSGSTTTLQARPSSSKLCSLGVRRCACANFGISIDGVRALDRKHLKKRHSSQELLGAFNTSFITIGSEVCQWGKV